MFQKIILHLAQIFTLPRSWCVKMLVNSWPLLCYNNHFVLLIMAVKTLSWVVFVWFGLRQFQAFHLYIWKCSRVKMSKFTEASQRTKHPLDDHKMSIQYRSNDPRRRSSEHVLFGGKSAAAAHFSQFSCSCLSRSLGDFTAHCSHRYGKIVVIRRGI